MKRWQFLFCLLIISVLLMLSCVKDSFCMTKNSEHIDVTGIWISFHSKSEWGPAIEIYDFYPEGRYRIVVALIPEDLKDNSVSTGFERTGTYVIQGNDMLFREKNGVEKNLKFERKEDMLFFAVDENNVQVLKKVEKWGEEKE